jgi:excinuclease ABC subunit C
MNHVNPHLKKIISEAPRSPGVYQFKAPDGAILYIGKARVLRARLKSYVTGYGSDWKATSLLDASASIEHIETESELAAMLLEARLIQSYQPPFNVLLKTGQPYTYFCITNAALPQFTMTRNKLQKGTYFGPFIEKTAARRAHRFLQESFQLQLCGKKIPGGCLAFHMKRCAGSCRPDFDRDGYLERLALLKRALRAPRTKMLAEFDQRIAQANTDLAFEQASQLVTYRKAVGTMYESLATKFDRPTSLQQLADRDVWVWEPATDAEPFSHLFVFRERQGVLTKARVFCLLGEYGSPAFLTEYMSSYYRLYRPAPQILVSHEIEEPEILADFVTAWHECSRSVVVSAPARSEQHELMLLARAQARHELNKKSLAGSQLRAMLSLKKVPRRIDCFDISHKQGHAMVGACVRFVNGQPEAKSIRNFHIKTVPGNNDYASLQEIVQRRYVDGEPLPDLIVIDGGKGQLSSVREVISWRLEGTDTDLISLAKREETVFSERYPEGKVLNQKSIAAQLLIALRDYAHHRAISFHRGVERRKIR